MRPEAAPSVDPGVVLGKALVRAAAILELPQRDLARVIGVSPSSLSRVERGRAVAPDRKEGELALLFLRVYRSLDALFGGDGPSCREWFHAENDHLGGVPAELVQNAQGLVHVAEYLDAMRGRV